MNKCVVGTKPPEKFTNGGVGIHAQTPPSIAIKLIRIGQKHWMKGPDVHEKPFVIILKKVTANHIFPKLGKRQTSALMLRRCVTP